jgi:hypothetical protein
MAERRVADLRRLYSAPPRPDPTHKFGMQNTAYRLSIVQLFSGIGCVCVWVHSVIRVVYRKIMSAGQKYPFW